MNQDYNVIVVGAGPGGSTAARFCAQAGLKTLLIEKERLPRYKPCGGCLSLKSVRLIEFDLTPVIENTIFGVKFTYRLNDPILIRSNNPIACMVMRDRFDQFLVERALEKGTTLLDGEKVTKVAENGHGVEVELARGRRFLCDYVVGADGPQSLIARSVAPLPPRGKGQGIAVESEIPFESIPDFPKEQHDLIHLDFGGVPNGYGWVFPKREWLSIGIGGMFQEGERMNPRHYYAEFVKGLHYLTKGETDRIMGHCLPPFYGETQKVSQGRVLLVGDAAHLMDPLMGEGIYYALRSGMLAAEAILQSKEKEIPPSDLYQKAVQSHLFDNLKWALRFSQFVFPLTRLAYRVFKRYPELADFYLQVLDGRDTYQGFVTRVKERMRDF
jgi:geranylgeranyl reductase family protein